LPLPSVKWHASIITQKSHMQPQSRWSSDTWRTPVTKVLLPSQLEASWLIVTLTRTLRPCTARILMPAGPVPSHALDMSSLLVEFLSSGNPNSFKRSA
jgi:hypothetical protein